MPSTDSYKAKKLFKKNLYRAWDKDLSKKLLINDKKDSVVNKKTQGTTQGTSSKTQGTTQGTSSKTQGTTQGTSSKT